MKTLATILFSLSLVLPAIAEKKVQMKDLPPAVRKAVEENTKGAEVKGLSKEVEKGKTMYEVETVANGKTRDMTFDATGAVVSVEQDVAIDSIPAPARAAIQKKAAGGKIAKVETITKGNSVTYEAAIVGKLGKKSEIIVAADGTVQK